MRLSKYDNKRVRITDKWNYVYEGNSSYYTKEENEIMYGGKEEGLKILNFMFYKSTIKKVEVLEDGFIDDYGLLEKEIVSDGLDYIIDAFEYEDNEHVCRLIKYIRDNKEIENREEIIKGIKDYLTKYNNDEEVLKELKSL